MNWTIRWTPTEELARDLEELSGPTHPTPPKAEGESLGTAVPGTAVHCHSRARSPGYETIKRAAAANARRAGLQLREVGCRVMQARRLLRPGRLNRLVHGCLARAQENEPEVKVCAYAVMSTHYHLLVITPDAPTLSRFMNVFQSALARAANRLYGWNSKFWDGRYSSVIVSDEPEVQLERLRYLLSQGCKEGLVASPLDWPGATSHAALMNGYDSIEGDWIDRTELYRRRRSGEQHLTERDVTSRNRVHLAKLPAFEHLSRAEYAAMVKLEIRAIERATRVRHHEEGTRPLGAAKVLAVDPQSRPETVKRSPRPKFHATKDIYKLLCAAYRQFLEAYGAASDRLRAGKVGVVFPAGCFPPAMPPRGAPPTAMPRAPG
jgi:REP element-mobilizing transposase RayT